MKDNETFNGSAVRSDNGEDICLRFVMVTLRNFISGYNDNVTLHYAAQGVSDR